QQIAAADEIEVREGRVGGYVVPGEDAEVANGLADLVVTVDAHEEAAQALGRDVDFNIVDVQAGPGPLQGGLVQVGGQDLYREITGAAVQVLQEDDGQGIDLLSGGAAGYPDPDGTG